MSWVEAPNASICARETPQWDPDKVDRELMASWRVRTEKIVG